MKSLENNIRQIMFESEKKAKEKATQAAYDAAAARNNPTEFIKKQKEAQKAAAKVAKGGLTPEGGNSIPEEKDEGEYGYEGDMAITQLKTIVRHCNDLISNLKPEEDLPEWVQSKITLATDYIQTASDYLNSVSEEAGAGEVGTDELVKRYEEDTPGQGTSTERISQKELHKKTQIIKKIIDEDKPMLTAQSESLKEAIKKVVKGEKTQVVIDPKLKEEAEECPTCVDGACQCAVEEGVMGENPLSREAQAKKKTIIGRIKQKLSKNPFDKEPSKKPRSKNPLAREEVEFSDEEAARLEEIVKALTETDAVAAAQKSADTAVKAATIKAKGKIQADKIKDQAAKTVKQN